MNTLTKFYHGIQLDVPADIYHALPELSNSDLKVFRKGPRYYYNKKVLGLPEDDGEFTDDERKSRVMGTLFHAAVIEPERFREMYHMRPETYPAPKTCKAVKSGKAEVGDMIPWSGNATFCQEWKDVHDDLPIVSPKDMSRIIGARDAVLAHPVAGALLRGKGYNEASVFATDPETGLGLRMRADRLTEDASGRPWCVDLKSAPDVDKFVRSAREYSYDIQDVFYRRTLALAGVPNAEFCFIVADLKPEYGVHAVRVVIMDDVTRAAAEEILRNDLRRFAKCKARDEWPLDHQDTELCCARRRIP
jgi:hypothetical protein